MSASPDKEAEGYEPEGEEREGHWQFDEWQCLAVDEKGVQTRSRLINVEYHPMSIEAKAVVDADDEDMVEAESNEAVTNTSWE